MIYLATPYTARNEDGSLDTILQHKRYIEACLAVGMLMIEGKLVYSPIVHWHMPDQLFPGQIQHEDYLAADVEMIKCCSEVHVVKMEGWDKSTGVRIEIEYAKQIALKPVKYCNLTAQGIVYDTPDS